MTEDEVRAKAVKDTVVRMGLSPDDDLISALTKFANAYEAAMWQPIETAPVDGTHVLMAHSENRIVEIGRVHDVGDLDFWLSATVTHWRPIPKPAENKQ